MQQLQDVEQKIKDSGALPYLLSGGVGALAGGGLAASVSRKGESKLGRLGRILGTGALSGLATGGAHKLLDYGIDQASNALPKEDVSPEQNLISGPGTRAVGGALAGTAMAGKAHMDDKRMWREISAQNPSLFGGGEKGFSSYSRFSQAKDGILGQAAKAPGASNNSYRDVLDSHAFASKGDRKILEEQLRALGIDATSTRFKALDPLRGHALNNAGATGKLADFVLRNEGKLMSARNKIVPALTKVTGRTPLGVLGRVGGIGAATMYPELLEGAANRVAGSSE